MSDEVDIANEYEENRMEEALLKFKLIRQTEQVALKNIVERECEDCGELIPIKRLKIVPLTRFCVRCQCSQE